MGKRKPVWFGMKVTRAQNRNIKYLDIREGTSAKEAVMRLVEQALANEKLEAPDGSFLSGIENIIESSEGPTDLASNPRYMEGFGR